MASKKKNPTPELIIIPYRHAVGTPESLHMAVASILKYSRLKDGVEIWILGDRPAMTLPGSVRHFPFESSPTLSPHVNIIRALTAFLADRKEKQFLLWHDDTLATTNFSVLDDFRPASLHPWPQRDEQHPNYFVADLSRTRRILEEKGIDPINFCCHAPHVYETRPFLQMVDDYHLQMYPLDFETLYFNLQGVVPDPVGQWQYNGYSTIIMPDDSDVRIVSKADEHCFISLAGTLTDPARYDWISYVVLGRPYE